MRCYGRQGQIQPNSALSKLTRAQVLAIHKELTEVENLDGGELMVVGDDGQRRRWGLHRGEADLSKNGDNQLSGKLRGCDGVLKTRAIGIRLTRDDAAARLALTAGGEEETQIQRFLRREVEISLGGKDGGTLDIM